MTSEPRLAWRTRIRRRFGVLAPLLLTAACDTLQSPPVAGPSSPQPAPIAVPPTITSLSPAMGVPEGGTLVQVVGTGLVRGARVAFGTAQASVNGYSPDGTLFNLTTAGHPSGTVDVVVTNPHGQTGRLDAAFTYGAAAPLTIDGISANSGPTAGGTSVTVRGAGFQRAAQVLIGGAAVTSRNVTSTAIVVRTFAHAAGTVELAVTTADGQIARSPGGFTFLPPAFTDFNGTWAGHIGDEWETAFTFTVRDDVLISLSCNASALAGPALPPTGTGEFVVSGADGRIVMTGGLARADHAEGLINLVGCGGYDTVWRADRR